MTIDLDTADVKEVEAIATSIIDRINTICKSEEYKLTGYDTDYDLDYVNFKLNKPIEFKSDETNQDVIDILNTYIDDHEIMRSGLEAVKLFAHNDVEKLKIRIAHVCCVKYYGNTDFCIKYDYFEFDINNSKEVLDHYYKYFKENPVLFLLDGLYYFRDTDDTYKKLLSHSYFIRLLTKAMNDYAELELLLQIYNM